MGWWHTLRINLLIVCGMLTFLAHQLIEDSEHTLATATIAGIVYVAKQLVSKD